MGKYITILNACNSSLNRNELAKLMDAIVTVSGMEIGKVRLGV